MVDATPQDDWTHPVAESTSQTHVATRHPRTLLLMAAAVSVGVIAGNLDRLIAGHAPPLSNALRAAPQMSDELLATVVGKQDTLTKLDIPTGEHAKQLNEDMQKDTSNIPKCTTDATSEAIQKKYNAFCERLHVTKNGVPEAEGGQPFCNKPMVQNNDATQNQCTALQNANATNGAEANCFGPLHSLIGTWVGTYGKVYSIVPNFAATGKASHYIPWAGQPTSDISGIKNQQYTEKLVFSPILGSVKNRGYENADMINAKCQANQFLQGVSYKLYIYQTSESDQNSDYGSLMHEEVGQWMYNSVPASGGGETTDWTVARMSVIPHGVTLVATGNNTYYDGPPEGAKAALLKEQNDFDLNTRVAPQDCVPADTYDTNGAYWAHNDKEYGWGEAFKGREDHYLDMNPLLTHMTEKVDVKAFATLSVKQEGDLSQTPFIKTQVKNSDFMSKLWIQNIVDEDGKEQARLQYGQKVTWTYMQQFRCLKCMGGTPKAPTMGPRDTPFNTKNKCYTSCRGMNQVWGQYGFVGPAPLIKSSETAQQPLEEGEQRYVERQSMHPEWALDHAGWTLDQIPPMQQRRCFSCTANNDDVQPAQAFNGDSLYPVNLTQIPIDYSRQTLQAKSFGKTCKDDPLAHWPHMQINTLTKVSDDFDDMGPLKEFASSKILGNLKFRQQGHSSEIKTPV